MSKFLRFNHGHGGKDVGATGYGKYERDEVKKFVIKLVKYLEANYTGMTIKYGPEKNSKGQFYGTKAYGTKSGGYYSFHMNAANHKASGTECYYYKYGTGRAQKVNDALDNFFTDRGIKYGDRDGDGYGDYYILRECGFDTIVEICFIDRKEDMDILYKNYNTIIKSVGDAIAHVEGLTKKKQKGDNYMMLFTDIEGKNVVYNRIRYPLKAINKKIYDLITIPKEKEPYYRNFNDVGNIKKKAGYVYPKNLYQARYAGKNSRCKVHAFLAKGSEDECYYKYSEK